MTFAEEVDQAVADYLAALHTLATLDGLIWAMEQRFGPDVPAIAATRRRHTARVDELAALGRRTLALLARA